MTRLGFLPAGAAALGSTADVADTTGRLQVASSSLPTCFIVRIPVTTPVLSGIAIRVCGHVFRDVCPWNVSFAQELAEPALAAREALAGTDSRTRALDDPEPLVRAHAAWALGRIRSSRDV